MIKRVAAIHSLAGFGKCSLTIILPVLSAMGIETCPLVTTVLSSHTGGLPGFTRRDLTQDLLPAARQWKNLKIPFDGIYSGFLGSPEQISAVSQLFDLLASEDTLIFVDPSMADNGKLYQTYTDEMAQGVKKLCEKADYILPNLTEAALLLNEPYRPEYALDRAEACRLSFQLRDRFGCGVILTGVESGNGAIGAVCLEKLEDTPTFSFSKKISRHFHGTGDLFASVFTGGILKGRSLRQSAQIAADFVSAVVERTVRDGTDERYGVNFERELPALMEIFQKQESL